jgi:hypothetical protein
MSVSVTRFHICDIYLSRLTIATRLTAKFHGFSLPRLKQPTHRTLDYFTVGAFLSYRIILRKKQARQRYKQKYRVHYQRYNCPGEKTNQPKPDFCGASHDEIFLLLRQFENEFG